MEDLWLSIAMSLTGCGKQGGRVLSQIRPGPEEFGEGRVDALATAQLCLDAFQRDHNTEHLVDAANYLMFRFMFPMPGEYFKTTDDSGSVGTVGTPLNMEGGRL